MVSCASKSETNLIFHVDPPPDADVACIGVVGFDVSVSSGGKTSMSGPLLSASGPVLDREHCRLPQPFSVQSADMNGPALVVITGHDGAGIARVQGSAQVDNLLGAAVHVQLKTVMSPPSPVLVINRSVLLSQTALSDVAHLKITTMRMMASLIDVTPGDYFSVEPAAYGVPNLMAGPADDGLALFGDVTTTKGVNLARTRLTAKWMPGGYYVATP